MHGTPREAAGRAADHGVSFVALLAVSQTSERGHVAVNRRDLEPYAKAFRERGIDVYVWGYPRAGWEQQFVQSLVAGAVLAGARGVIADPEKSYKHRPGELLELRDRLEQCGYPVTWTTYGLPFLHDGFPWRVIDGHGAGSPQLYTVPVSQARRGLREWRDAGWTHLVPSIPAFGPNSGWRMAGYAAQILGQRTRGAIVWNWRHLGPHEWRNLPAIVEEMGW